ncbi:hypothetical protein MRX96_048377 [Rhipicephalus microplus]
MWGSIENDLLHVNYRYQQPNPTFRCTEQQLQKGRDFKFDACAPCHLPCDAVRLRYSHLLTAIHSSARKRSSIENDFLGVDHRYQVPKPHTAARNSSTQKRRCFKFDAVRRNRLFRDSDSIHSMYSFPPTREETFDVT